MTIIQFWSSTVKVALRNALAQSAYGHSFEDCFNLAVVGFIGSWWAHVQDRFSVVNWRSYLELIKLELQAGIAPRSYSLN